MKNLLFLVILLVSHAVIAQETETRKVSSFSKLEAGGSFDVIIEKGSENVITIEAKGVDPQKIITEVRGDVLKVYLEKGNYRNIHATVYITYENLEAISSSGSGNMISKSDLSAPEFSINNSGSGNLKSQGNIKTTHLSFNLSGSGNCELASLETEDFALTLSGSGNFKAASGYATRFSIHKSGSGNIDAFEVKSDLCTVSASGSGNISLYANKSIEGNISGSSNINYQGDAMVSKVKVSGSGKIIRH